ncbi:hypothetical protein BKA67DRAFT_688452 [Truncatella angustata]|uniref:Uncharacterized protein n=1 Tax=Truncatella angustata TaxID=152316 RepID=A0A9P8ZZC5_9PEZI|nr:uncharacterized protein BKA67DRAFT_688452 [Truncatella angustata]KAH6657092.1 hypothetical protein BKA67DRAFT_688452 [Truncatella angustata]KAH8197496.1 hypothetical protein TruAng_008354 [Truncatella angustata]
MDAEHKSLTLIAMTHTQSTKADQALPTTTTAIAADPTLGYKLRVLLHDLRNISPKGSGSAKRLGQTTNHFYLSLPYFTPQEAGCLKNAVIDRHEIPAYSFSMHIVSGSDMNDHDHPSWQPGREILRGMVVEDAINVRLGHGLVKRKSSGDSRSCPPYDLAPLYEMVFGIKRGELEDEEFLGRLGHSGLASL